MISTSGNQNTRTNVAISPRRLSPVSKVALPTSEGLRFERIETITYLEASGNYTYLHFQNGQRALVCKTLQEMNQRLAQPHRFIRIHRSFIINIDYLERYVRGKGGYVVLEGDIPLAVSAGKRPAFMEAIERYFH